MAAGGRPTPPTCMMYHAAAIISATARPSPLKINNGKANIHSTIPCTVRVVDKCFVFFVVRDYSYYVPPSSSSQHNAILFITITATSVASLTHNHTRNSFLPIKSISYLIDQSYIRENIGCHTTITHYYAHYIYDSSTRQSSCFCFPIICIG